MREREKERKKKDILLGSVMQFENAVTLVPAPTARVAIWIKPAKHFVQLAEEGGEREREQWGGVGLYVR